MKINEAKVRAGMLQYIERRGWRIIDESYYEFIVAFDTENEDLVFVEFSYSNDFDEEPEPMARDAFERLLLMFASDMPDVIEELGGNFKIRMDELHFVPTNDRQGIIRHHFDVVRW